MRTDPVLGSLFKPTQLPWKPVGGGNTLSGFMRSSSCYSSSSHRARFRISSAVVDEDRGDLQSEEKILDIEEKPMREYSWADPKVACSNHCSLYIKVCYKPKISSLF